MFYALVSYTYLNSKALDDFRRKYDPTVDLVSDHITLVFPVPDIVGYENITSHVERVTSQFKPFDVHLKGFEKSWDHWLFLIVQEGNDHIVELHDRLYTGILKNYLWTDIPFIPHIGLGLFADDSYDLKNPKSLNFDSDIYKKALEEASTLDLDFWRKIEKLTLVQLDDQFKSCEDLVEFRLA